jgi:phosphoribosylformylglycinamidine synthase
MAGMRLGVWVAHGEGQFGFPYGENKYNIPVKYAYGTYPANPNGSAFNAAGICSDNGRHVAMMPHPERALFPWQWPHYPEGRRQDDLSPWVVALRNAFEWVKANKKG